MSISKTAISLLTSGALMASVIPAAAARTVSGPSVSASKERCESLAGREQSRCMTIQRRNNRMRLQTLDRHVTGRGMTMREQRVVKENKPQTNIRGIGNMDLKNMRMHILSGGNTRRAIMNRASDAREACNELEGTEQHLCVRDHMKAFNQ